MKTFRDKVALITGAGSGLGRALAQHLHREGARLALLDRDAARLAETAAGLSGGPAVSQHPVDVAQRGPMHAAVAEAVAGHGQLDLLINNAGITLTPTPFEHVPEAQFEQVLAVNLWGVVHGTRACLPHLRQRPEAGVINIASLAGLVGLYGYSPYAMSKFAVRGLSETLQMEFAGTGLHILTVYPGGIKTNIIRHAPDLTEAERERAHAAFTQAATLTPEAAATHILRAFRRRQLQVVLGADARLVTLIRALFPGRYPQLLQAAFRRMTFRGEAERPA